MNLKFNIPRTTDPATCSTHQPRYVRLVPEATWRRIAAVLNADKTDLGRDFYEKWLALSDHLDAQQ